VHQRWQQHLWGAKGRFGGLQGLQRGFPLHLLTLMFWVLAWFDHSPVPPGCLRAAGVRGVAGCPGHKPPPEGWQLGGGGRRCCPRRVKPPCASHVGWQRAVLPRSCPPTALLGSRAPVQQRPRPQGCPEKGWNKSSIPLQPRLCGAKLLGLAGQRSDRRMAVGPCSNLAWRCKRSRLSRCPGLEPPCSGHPPGVEKCSQQLWNCKGLDKLPPSTFKRALVKCLGKARQPQDPTPAQGRASKPHPQPPDCCDSHSPTQQHPRHVSSRLTLRYHLAEDGQGVQRGAVPAAVAELVLALFDGQLGSAPH